VTRAEYLEQGSRICRRRFAGSLPDWVKRPQHGAGYGEDFDDDELEDRLGGSSDDGSEPRGLSAKAKGGKKAAGGSSKSKKKRKKPTARK
jgi:hypothetical protein